MAATKTISKLFALQWALQNESLTRSDAFVLASLIEYANGAVAWPSVETIAAVTGLARRTVQRSLRRLEEAKIIETTEGRGRTRTSRYRVMFDRFAQSPLAGRIRAAADLTKQKATRESPFSSFDGDAASEKRRHLSPEKASFESRKGDLRVAQTLLKNPLKNPSAPAATHPAGCVDPCVQKFDHEGRQFADALGKVGKGLGEERPDQESAYERRRNRTAQTLREIEADIKAGSPYAALWRWLDWLAEVAESRRREPLGEWARRLHHEITYLGPQ
ncbi:MAG: hypothetical protein Kow00133_15880 [Amphiplicatus sp.]